MKKRRRRTQKKAEKQKRLAGMKAGGLSQLEKKANELAGLAVKHPYVIGAENVLLVLRDRKHRDKIRQRHPNPREREEFTIKLVFHNRECMSQRVAEINEWLEKIGRHDLRVTEKEVLDLILA